MARWIPLLLVAALVAGCGGSGKGPAGTLAGKVTFQGAPVAEGVVTFVKVGGGGSGVGEIQSDGSYKATGVEGAMPVGEYVAVVVPPEVTRDRGPNSPPDKVFKEMKNIPEKYRSDTKTDLRVTVKEGQTEYNIEMK